MTEFIHCLDAHLKRAWEIAKLKNMSLIAHMTNDVEWQHEICSKLDEMNKALLA